MNSADDSENLAVMPEISWGGPAPFEEAGAVQPALAAALELVVAPAPAARDAGPCFFYLDAGFIEFAEDSKMSRDELLLYMLHCRGYHPRHRGSTMGEKAAHDRLWLSKKPWKAAEAELGKKGLIWPVKVANVRAPITRLAPSSNLFTPEGRSPLGGGEPPDRYAYKLVHELELIKMPWRLIEGADGTEPVLAELQTREQVLVLLALYRVARGDGLVPRRYARMDERGQFQHGLLHESHLIGEARVLDGLKGLMEVGLLYPACEDTRGSQVLWLYHPLDMTVGMSAHDSLAPISTSSIQAR